ncbi:MAG: ATP-binding cassette domain-containing protein [Spirochaetales bacterium]|nr:ATP-binding cassette domain-containing protein [Spirochaetales bacterium]
MSRDTPLVEIKELTHKFQSGHTALTGVSLSIPRESFTVIGGENGSGKTVLMKHLNGILSPTSGIVYIDGTSVAVDTRAARRKVGLVFQNSDTQLVAQTVSEDIAFGPENLGLSNEEIERRVKEASDAMDLSAILDESPHRLSGGEKKKTAIAGVLSMEPELIVFDEPFAGLDYRGVRMLLHKMLTLHNQKKTIIVITHDLEKVLAHADRLVIMAGGQVVCSGVPAEILKDAAAFGLRVPSHMNHKRMTWLDETS